MSLECAKEALSCLSEYITRYYNKKPIILIDEYDTPMQEAWIHGYWDDIVSFFRGFFNSTFKTNPWLDRGLMTGITRISKDSLFSDMNNLEVVTVTSPFYSDCFGFTEEEVFASLDEYGLGNKDGVKAWYDGFTFGCDKDIYNPWSIIQYIRKNEFDTYWVDTSSNSLVSSLIQQSKKELKIQFESLLQGKSIITNLDEQIVFNQLKIVPGAVLSLLIAAGYLNVVSCDKSIKQYEIEITNYEVRTMLEALIKQWFNSENLYSISHEFRNALCECRIDRMNLMMNKISMETFSYFDMSGKEPEKFYHGFTLGLIADLKGRYQVESNRESGYGRYDVMLFPLQSQDPGIVIEFKSLASDEGEKDLDDTLAAALKQIADRQYVAALEARGIPHDHIYAYGFAFHGKDVLIGGGKL